MKETIYNFIKNREKELANANKYPTHVLDIEIFNNFGKKESKKYLNQLVKENRIIFGRTLNNVFFKTVI